MLSASTGISEPPGVHGKEGKMDYFKDKVALVTGGSRGTGLATARALALRGARVVITARGEDRLLGSREMLEAEGHEVLAVAGDVGDWDRAHEMVAAAIEKFGRLDVVVNNAGVSMRGQFRELSREVCERVERTNLTGCINVTRAAIDKVIEARGHIVFISSVAGIFGLPGASIYCATKKALTGLSESLRIELIPKGVHVGVVHLGFTEHDPEKRIMAADGSMVPPDRPAHYTQQQAAQKIVRMIEKRKKHIVLTRAGWAGYLAYRLSPRLLERAVLMAQSSGMGAYRKFS